MRGPDSERSADYRVDGHTSLRNQEVLCLFADVKTCGAEDVSNLHERPHCCCRQLCKRSDDPRSNVDLG